MVQCVRDAARHSAAPHRAPPRHSHENMMRASSGNRLLQLLDHSYLERFPNPIGTDGNRSNWVIHSNFSVLCARFLLLRINLILSTNKRNIVGEN